MAYCGTWSKSNSDLSPCIFLPLHALLLLATEAVLLLSHAQYRTRHTRNDGKLLHSLSILSTVGLASTHLVLLVKEGVAQAPALLISYDAVLLVVWLMRSFYAHRLIAVRNAIVRKVYLVTMALLYGWALRQSVRLFLDKDMPSIDLWRLVASACELGLVLPYVCTEWTQRDSIELDDLEAPLLANGDADLAGKKKRRAGLWLRLSVQVWQYVWPKKWTLRLRVVFCLILLGIGRALNVFVPVFYGKMVDRFEEVVKDINDSEPSSPPGAPPAPDSSPGVHYTIGEVFLPYVLVYCILFFVQGGGFNSMGLLNNTRQFVWIRVSQETYRRISKEMYAHLLRLPLDFHLKRKTGEVMRVMDRGTSSIQGVLQSLFFSVLPTLCDIGIATVYFATHFEAWFAVIVFVTLGSYIPLTVTLTEWRTQFRRDMNRMDNLKGQKMTDGLINYETVKYFANEQHEVDMYNQAILNYQEKEYYNQISLNFLNTAQSIVIVTGLVSGLLLCSARIAEARLSAGDAVVFISYMLQLYQPLNFFGSYYRTIQQNFIDMENMFDLLEEQPSLRDAPDAKKLVVSGGQVKFDNVRFSYDAERLVVKGLNFMISPGQTVALVGATGSGKSTVLRLLFRFYDVTSGSITIDDQDISGVTQDSLHRAIGVVPQDCVLFNDTIMYNIRYGRVGASDDEVMDAAQAASIHQSIVERFPKKYDTMVGERGLRLSGGEKQRVAFARTILKQPPLLLLDEATSALDSLTEKQIQASLTKLREKTTTLIIAHRLSTVMDADQIIVMGGGEILEQGTHQTLLDKGGEYYLMWMRQQQGDSFNDLRQIADKQSSS
mmetsp:Transcript_7021/g.25884  ORF Transcript_7021/g.25884 Transcript_7021/m.25884 type:complete len:831 (-) Transcript_7021:549-3041(-)|eukprot:scaffold323_cov414-Prasinococcus_capsulatus_cf.AAC.44